MAPKKGYSIEEKKQSILKFFQDEYSFYTIKELEKLIPKRCPGVSSMIVKDLLQTMIDEDGLISVEKCGNINVYWCFKNKINQKIFESCEKVQNNIEEKKKHVENLEEKISSSKSDEKSDIFKYNNTKYKRAVELEKMKLLDAQHKALQNEYNDLVQNLWDSSTVSSKTQKLEKENETLSKLSDNIDSIISYLANKYLVNSRDIRKEYGIQEEFKEYANEISSI